MNKRKLNNAEQPFTIADPAFPHAKLKPFWGACHSLYTHNFQIEKQGKNVSSLIEILS